MSRGCRTHGAAGEDKFRLLERKDLPAEEARHADPAGDGDGDDDRKYAGLHDEDQKHDPEHLRNGGNQLTKAHHDVICRAAEIAGNAAVQKTDGSVEKSDHNRQSEG